MGEPLINLLVGLAVVAILVYLAWPRRGLLARIRQARHASRRAVSENILKTILKVETEGRTVTLEELAGATETSRDRITEILQEMENASLLTLENGVPSLRPEGRDAALHIVRAHRIWERHLADQTGVEEEYWHAEAEEAEHRLSPEQVRDLSTQLGNPTVDPHGDPIPPEGADLRPIEGVAITALESGDQARIVHLEDEPPAVYAQLVAEGLTPGMVVHVVEKSSGRVHFWADGNEVVLAPIVAANVTVRTLEKEVDIEPASSLSLRDIEPGRRAVVASISRSCRGPMRRRLLDLGVVPGTTISVERSAPGGDPVAYRIRGATIALRESQASQIRVEAVESEKS